MPWFTVLVTVFNRMIPSRFLLQGFAVILLLCYGSGFSQPASNTAVEPLNKFIDQWHRDAAMGNHAAYIGAMTADGVYIGTDASERWTTAEFSTWSKPWFDKKKTWNFKAITRNIHIEPHAVTAWFDELLDTHMGICRGSGVLQKKDGQWKIAQYVLSPTVPNNLMHQVTDMKSIEDTALMLKLIFDRHNMNGTIVVLDAKNNRYSGHQPALWDSGYLPASTFKIANSLAGLESGVIDTSYIFKWNGVKRRLPQWDKDLTLREAFRVSCVPCYQEVARKIGSERMISYLDKMQYPGMDVHPENIDLFWLEGKSRITPMQQLDFIKRLYEEKLPISPSAMRSVKSIMVVEKTPQYTLSGKTGWAVRNGNNYGWFIGWVETKNNVYYLATLVEPKNQEEISDFAAARKWITMEVLERMGVIEVAR
jgi:beta-lactamase class D